jgi:hypothetical protein
MSTLLVSIFSLKLHTNGKSEFYFISSPSRSEKEINFNIFACVESAESTLDEAAKALSY